jgi:hypothetical protein
MISIVLRYREIAELQNWRCMRPLLAVGWAFVLSVTIASHAQDEKQHPSFEILTHRMDVDVDGAPNAYGPPGMQALDIPLNAHSLNRADKEIVGYLVDEHGRPILQGPNDPFPGYYISQTAFTDIRNHAERDPRRYVDARNINYVVRGDVARGRGVRVGDFVSFIRSAPAGACLLSSEILAIPAATKARFTYCRI